MSTKIKLTIIRPCLVDGVRVEVGRIEVDALTANDLISCGRAVLVNDEDAKAVREAVQADVRRAIKAAGQPWAQAQPGPAWTRVH